MLNTTKYMISQNLPLYKKEKDAKNAYSSEKICK